MPTEYFLSRKIGDTVYCGCPPCDVVFANLDAIIAGFASCGCIAFPDDNTSLKIDHVDGVVGAFSALVGTTTIGTAFIQPYGLGDQTCTTPQGSPAAATVSLDITCLGPILFPEITIVGFGLIFQNALGGRIGDIITNDLVCGGGLFGIVGSVQLFLP